jgi:hypothetical protein
VEKWLIYDGTGRQIGKDSFEYTYTILEHFGIDPARYEIERKENEINWYKIEGYKTILAYKFKREE